MSVTWRDLAEARREFREMVRKRETVEQQKREARKLRAAQIAREHAEAFSRPLIGEEYRPSEEWRKSYESTIRGVQRWHPPLQWSHE